MFCSPAGGTPIHDHTGIVKVSYDPTTGVLDSTAAFDQSPSFLVTGTSTGGNYVNATNFEIDTATHKLYYTDWDNNYSFDPFTPTNAIYVVSDYTAANPTVTKLTDDAQFPADSSNGLIGNIAIDDAKGLIYFTTLDLVLSGAGPPLVHVDRGRHGHQDHGSRQSQFRRRAGRPVARSCLAAALHLDGLHPESATPDANHVLVYQLSADGHSLDSLVASYTLDQLEGQTPNGGDNAHPGASVWNELPLLSLTDPGAHAVEQGSAITVAGSRLQQRRRRIL